MVVNLDSLYFNVGKDYFKAKFLSKGLNAPHISTQAKASLNLTNFNNAIGLNGLDLAGILNLDIKANGTYNTAVHKMPTLNGTINFQNGKIKTKYYPNPIKNINLIASVNNKTGFLKDGSLYIEKGRYLRLKCENLNARYSLAETTVGEFKMAMSSIFDLSVT